VNGAREMFSVCQQANELLTWSASATAGVVVVVVGVAAATGKCKRPTSRKLSTWPPAQLAGSQRVEQLVVGIGIEIGVEVEVEVEAGGQPVAFSRARHVFVVPGPWSTGRGKWAKCQCQGVKLSAPFGPEKCGGHPF